ncbi:MAG: energy transducer TonB [Pseudomonadota bacterium]
MNNIKTALAVAAAVMTSTVFGGVAIASEAEREVVNVEAPEYPRGAQRRELEGHVTVRYNVTEAGEVADVEVVESEPAGVFDRAVLRALEGWEYAPADTVTAGIERSFAFNLDG